jgi:hypothetical protein
VLAFLPSGLLRILKIEADDSKLAAPRRTRNGSALASKDAAIQRGAPSRAGRIDSGTTSRQIVHMRVTITISEDLLRAAKEISGKSGDSAALVTSLQD